LARRQANRSGISAIAMGKQESPRSRVKELLKGEVPATPLLMPIVFALGSRLQSVSVADFARNPTWIANALRQIRATLRVDGLCCYFDRFLEAEALGGRLEWTSDGTHLTVAPSLTEVQKTFSCVDDIAARGRVPVALEVLKRSRMMLKDEPALMVRVTGPLTLASQFAGLGDRLDRDAVEFGAGVATVLTKAYLEAGADVILLTEDRLPAPFTADLYEQWGPLLDPVINVIRFYEALPVLVLGNSGITPEWMSRIASRKWDCVLCVSASTLRAAASERWPVKESILGVAATPEDFVGATVARGFMEWVAQSRTVLLTTSDDIPVQADLKQLAAVCQQVRGAVAAAP
jgi:uroporphyrinogen decarboxylase-like protein